MRRKRRAILLPGGCALLVMARNQILLIMTMPALPKACSEASQPRRKRGAPIGNTNALKHGFYSRDIRKIESGDLDALTPEGLADEVVLLRIVLRRLFTHASSTPDEKLMISDFKSLSVISMHLATVLSKHRSLTGEESPFTQMLSNQINKAFDENFIRPKKQRRRSP